MDLLQLFCAILYSVVFLLSDVVLVKFHNHTRIKKVQCFFVDKTDNAEQCKPNTNNDNGKIRKFPPLNNYYLFLGNFLVNLVAFINQ